MLTKFHLVTYVKMFTDSMETVEIR